MLRYGIITVLNQGKQQMKIAANDPRLNVITVNDHEIVIQFSGKIEGNVLGIKGKDTHRVLNRVTENKFHGRNGKRTMIVVEV